MEQLQKLITEEAYGLQQILKVLLEKEMFETNWLKTKWCILNQ